LMGVQLGCIFVGFYVFSKRSDTSSCQILTKQPERFMGCRFHIVVYLVVWWGWPFPFHHFTLQIRHFSMIHLEIQVLSQHKTRIILWYPMLVGYSIGIPIFSTPLHPIPLKLRLRASYMAMFGGPEARREALRGWWWRDLDRTKMLTTLW
jgi:hypothetical protein